MVQWIAILVALVCLCGSSLSRSWGYDDDEYFESSFADSSEKNQNYKKYWDSEEDYEDSYERGYGHDRSSNQQYHYDRDEFGYFGTDQDHEGFGHEHNENYGYNHQGHDHKNNNGHKPGFTPNWGSHQNGQGQMFYRNENDHGHSTSQTGSGQTGPMGSQGRPSQTGFPVQSGQNSGSTSRGPQNNENGRSSANGDRIIFPDFNNRIPATSTRAPSTPRPSSTSTRPSTTTSRALLDLVLCVRTCPVTPEYNPVCGTNNVTYNNPGILECARNCGVNVSLARRAPCPRLPSTTTNRPTSTTLRPTTAGPAATTVPARFNINNIFVNQTKTTLVPVDVLLSIFGRPSTNANTEDPEFDIDRRRTTSIRRL